jgi:hypothetical protein
LYNEDAGQVLSAKLKLAAFYRRSVGSVAARRDRGRVGQIATIGQLRSRTMRGADGKLRFPRARRAVGRGAQIGAANAD